jgi:hypothetical protein
MINFMLGDDRVWRCVIQSLFLRQWERGLFRWQMVVLFVLHDDSHNAREHGRWSKLLSNLIINHGLPINNLLSNSIAVSTNTERGVIWRSSIASSNTTKFPVSRRAPSTALRATYLQQQRAASDGIFEFPEVRSSAKSACRRVREHIEHCPRGRRWRQQWPEWSRSEWSHRAVNETIVKIAKWDKPKWLIGIRIAGVSQISAIYRPTKIRQQVISMGVCDI